MNSQQSRRLVIQATCQASCWAPLWHSRLPLSTRDKHSTCRRGRPQGTEAQARQQRLLWLRRTTLRGQGGLKARTLAGPCRRAARGQASRWGRQTGNEGVHFILSSSCMRLCRLQAVRARRWGSRQVSAAICNHGVVMACRDKTRSC